MWPHLWRYAHFVHNCFSLFEFVAKLLIGSTVFFKDKLVLFGFSIVSVSRPVVHYEVVQILDSVHKMLTLQLKMGTFRLFFLVLNIELLWSCFVLFAGNPQNLTCSKHFPVFVILYVKPPLFFVYSRYHRVFIQLKNYYVVKYGNIHLHLPQIIKILSVSCGWKWSMPLSQTSIEIVQWHKIALIHHGQISPYLYHFSTSMHKHLSLAVNASIPIASYCAPQRALSFLLVNLLLPMPVYDISIKCFHQLLRIENPFDAP